LRTAEDAFDAAQEAYASQKDQVARLERIARAREDAPAPSGTGSVSSASR
jgi:hypothetical protein